jgi:hypothetical protein
MRPIITLFPGDGWFSRASYGHENACDSDRDLEHDL